MLEISGDTNLCKSSGVQLTAIHSANSGVGFEWSPPNLVSDADIANPIASLWQETTFAVTVTSDSGCARTDSVTINVVNLMNIEFQQNDPRICRGDVLQLNPVVFGLIMQDNFDNGIDQSQWSEISGALSNNTCGSISGNALHFSGAGRRAETRDFDVSLGGSVAG